MHRTESVGVAVESDNKLNGALSCAAAAACAGNFGFPIGLFFVEAARGLAALGNRCPRLVCARYVSNKAAGGNGNLAHMRGFTLGHAEAAGLFGGGGKLRRDLGAGIRQGNPKEAEERHSAKEE